MKAIQLLTLAAAFSLSVVATAQEPVKEEKKIQEVIAMDADPAPTTPNADGSMPEPDSASMAVKPMASGELLNRAVNWVKLENPKYTKTNRVTAGSKAECIATFKYKPKELNPAADVEGTIHMHVSIEAKEGKYRYTISKIEHTAKNGSLSGGNLYSEVPQCGSMKMPTDLWKRIKSEGMKEAAQVAGELKEAMKVPSDMPVEKKEEW